MEGEDRADFYDEQVPRVHICASTMIGNVPVQGFFIGQIGWRPIAALAKDRYSASPVRIDVDDIAAKYYFVTIYNMFADGAQIMAMGTPRGKSLMKNITTDEEPVYVRSGTGSQTKVKGQL